MLTRKQEVKVLIYDLRLKVANLAASIKTEHNGSTAFLKELLDALSDLNEYIKEYIKL